MSTACCQNDSNTGALDCEPTQSVTPLATDSTHDPVVPANVLKRPVDRELIALFLSEAPQWVAGLREAVTLRDRANIILITHRLKGSSTYLGARHVLAISKHIAKQAQQDQLDGLESQVADLIYEFERVRQALQSLLDDSAH